MAIALDGSLPDSTPDGLPGQASPNWADRRGARKFTATSALTGAYDRPSGSSGARLLAGAGGQNGQPARRTAAAERPVTAADLEPRLVKGSFAQMASAGPAAMEYFYARLFAFSPDTRALFPMSMTAQRERMFAALARLVWSLDNQPGCAEILTQLGRSHRRFGVTERHYPIFFAALRDTAEHFIGAGWTPETAAAWQVALDFIAATMGVSGAGRQERTAVVDRRDRLARTARSRRGGAAAAAEPAAALPGRAVRSGAGDPVAASLAAVLDRDRAAARRPDRAARQGRSRRPGQQHARASLRRRRLRPAGRAGRQHDAGRLRPRPAVRCRRHRAGADQGDHRAGAELSQPGRPRRDHAVRRRPAALRPV